MRHHLPETTTGKLLLLLTPLLPPPLLPLLLPPPPLPLLPLGNVVFFRRLRPISKSHHKDSTISAT